MRKLALTNGGYTLVDDGDYEHLSQFGWRRNSSGYAHRFKLKRELKNYKRTKRYGQTVHAQVLKSGPGEEIDHINGDRLDNRKSNLRLANRSQNMMNKSKTTIPKTSIYKGVNWHTNAKQWYAQIILKGKRYSIGYFKREHHAAMAYDIWAKELFGEFAKPNFLQVIMGEHYDPSR